MLSRYARPAGRATLYRGASWAGKKLGGIVGRYAANKYNSRSSYKKRPSESSHAVTYQHDSSVTYRRRRAPRRVRRAVARSFNRFIRNDAKSLGLISRSFPHTFASGVITPSGLDNSQVLYSDGLYGAVPGSVSWGNLWQIAYNELKLSSAGKFFFRSAVQNTQLRNASTTDVLCADVYEIVARKDGFNDPELDLANAFKATTAPTGTTKTTPTTLGATPFDAGGFGSSWLIKRKTTYRISPGNSIYLQLRSSRKMLFDTDRFEYDVTADVVRTRMFKGLTQGYLMILRAADPVSGGYMGPVSYEIVSVKTYHYGQDAYDTAEAGFQ